MKAYTRDLNINNDGNLLVTNELQDLINSCEHLVINKGIYLTGPLFLHPSFTLELEEGATLLATTDEANYHDIKTRVAGIGMDWYPAIINVIKCSDVLITGKGIINGNGSYWYNKYWGNDTHGGMRSDYDARGLRFACDYDCKRPRNILVQSSNDVKIEGITSYESGFWNVHILYSFDVEIDGINILSDNLNSPSTDGIDIDSSYDCLIHNVISNTNDDSICIKSGRDYSGYLVNKPCHDITIKDCIINKGFGITIGSEITGGVYDINIDNIKYNGTDCGFRIKSAQSRKGYIRDIKISNLDMHNVKYAFHMELNWNPNYSNCVIPANLSNYPDYYDLLAHEMPSGLSNTEISDIYINNVKSYFDNDYDGISRAFNIIGFNDVPIRGLHFRNMDIHAKEYGFIKNTDYKLINCNIKNEIENDNRNDDYDNR